MEHGHEVGAMVVAEVRRRLIGESLPRLRTCLGMLSEDEIWFRPNAETVSVGNLVLHLCGNVRQWILSALGGRPDSRCRQSEFDEPGPIPTPVLLAMVDEIEAGVTATLDRLTPDGLAALYHPQGFDETGVAILIHVTEHFSYHVGQITYAVKSRKGVDMGYYAGIDLSGRSSPETDDSD